MLVEDNSTECLACKNPLTWMGKGKRTHQGRDVYELDFRCDSCKREFRFSDGTLKELKVERDAVAEQLAIRRAEIDKVRNRRCLGCGGPLDDWLTCEWCHEKYSVDRGELVPRIEEAMRPKPRMCDFYAQR